MRKQLSIGVALLFAVACKTESPTPAAAGSAGEQPTPTVRSAKIDLKPVRPAAPAAPALPDSAPAGDRDQGGGDREQWRNRRARIDTDGDGVVSDAERDAAMKARLTEMHSRLDTDGDGKVTPAELANARGRMHFDDPAAIDTNHDGDISTDELAAAMKARRDERRGRMGSGSQTTP